MVIIKTQNKLNNHLFSLREENKKIGFVPTMGALHQGHLSLVNESKKKTDVTVVSIFVNPTQFENNEDLLNYPKTIDRDVQLLNNENTDILYIPTIEDLYSNEVVSDNFCFAGIENQMEGKYRKGHFNGVGTIIKKFFEIVKPNYAFFGEKDFQQLQIVKKLVENYKIPVKIVGCKIYREKNGLAMSSRNTRLTYKQRESSSFIYEILIKAKKKFKTNTIQEVIEWVKNQFKKHPILKLEYFTIADEESLVTSKNKEKNKKYRGFIAVYAGKIRLIDNIRF